MYGDVDLASVGLEMIDAELATWIIEDIRQQAEMKVSFVSEEPTQQD
jgi:hypothetical protein